MFCSCNHEPDDLSTLIDTKIPSIQVDIPLSSDTIIIGRTKKKEFKFIMSATDNAHVFKISSKTPLFSKYSGALFPIQTKDDLAIYKNQIDLQQKMKQADLIGLDSRFIKIRYKEDEKLFFFQEGFDKRIAESNMRREGLIFTADDQLTCVSGNNSKNEEKINLLRDKFFKNNFSCGSLFDLKKTQDFLSILEKMNLPKKSIAFYLNPVSNLLEPFVSLQTNNTSEAHVSKIETCTKTKTNNASELFRQDLICNKYFYLNENNVYPHKKDITITEIVSIPASLKLILKPGDRIDIINEGALISYSPVEILGTPKDPVYIASSDQTSNGMHVICANKKSIIKYAVFDKHRSLNYKGWQLPSSVTFYESEVKIESTAFNNNKSEDALNIFRSGFILDRVQFKNTNSDSFDADFSNGQVVKCKFENSGNDGVDVSGGKVLIQESTFNLIRDKAISSGEESSITCDNINIDYAAIALTAKDKSKIKISRSTISNSELVYCAFRKKREFGPSSIESEQVALTNNRQSFLIEEKSSITIDGAKMEGQVEDVKEMLYGEIFGIKTIR